MYFLENTINSEIYKNAVKTQELGCHHLIYLRVSLHKSYKPCIFQYE